MVALVRLIEGGADERAARLAAGDSDATVRRAIAKRLEDEDQPSLF